MTDRFNAEMGHGMAGDGFASDVGERQDSVESLWREYPLGENGKLCISTNLRNHLLEKGIKVNELGRVAAADIALISADPHEDRSVDVFAGTNMSQQRWVNEMTDEISQAVGFPVVVKKSLGIEREDLTEQFKKMMILRTEADKHLSDEQKQKLAVAEVLAVVSIGVGENQQEYLFMEKVEGEQMGVKERVPDDLRETFGVEMRYGVSRETSWNDLRYALKQKGLAFDDFMPRNIKIQRNEQDEKKYVVLDQGGKYENDGWFVM